MDERMQKMILARVQTINKGITSIAVATDETNLKAIEELSDALENATSLSSITTQADELASKLTVYKE
jgi:methyl-accepting chemotaxis protein